jgi:hypothetical protein
MFRLTLLVSLLLSAGFAAAQTLAPKDVDLVAPDGTKLRATFFAAAKPGPGVLLMHMCKEYSISKGTDIAPQESVA